MYGSISMKCCYQGLALAKWLHEHSRLIPGLRFHYTGRGEFFSRVFVFAPFPFTLQIFRRHFALLAYAAIGVDTAENGFVKFVSESQIQFLGLHAYGHGLLCCFRPW